MTEHMANLIACAIIIGIALLVVRFLLRERAQFCVAALMVNRQRTRINNRGNAHGLRSGKNQFFVVVKNKEVLYTKSLSTPEIKTLQVDEEVEYFGYVQLWLRGKRVIKHDFVELNGSKDYLDWRVIS